jgi:hypothetical protein
MDGWNRKYGWDADHGILVTPSMIDQAVEMIVSSRLRLDRMGVESSPLVPGENDTRSSFNLRDDWLATRTARIFLKEACGLDEVEVERLIAERYAERSYNVNPEKAPLPGRRHWLIAKLEGIGYALRSFGYQLFGLAPPDTSKGGQRDLYH